MREFSVDLHSVASTNSTASVRAINASTRASFEHLAARARNSVGLGGTRLSSGSSVGAGGTSFLFVVRVGLASSLSNSLGILLVLVDSPVKDVVVLESLANKEITEDLSQVAVVGLVVESERSSIVEINGKFVGESAAENLGRGRHLLLHDSVILLLLGGSLQALPRQGATAKVQHDIAERLHIVTSRLLHAQMGIN